MENEARKKKRKAHLYNKTEVRRGLFFLKNGTFIVSYLLKSNIHRFAIRNKSSAQIRLLSGQFM